MFLVPSFPHLSSQSIFRFVVSADSGARGTLVFWDFEDGRPLLAASAAFDPRSLAFHVSLTHVVFSPNSRFVAGVTLGPNSHVIVWDWKKGFALAGVESLAVRGCVGIVWFSDASTIAVAHKEGLVFLAVGDAGDVTVRATREFSGVGFDMKPDTVAGICLGPAAGGNIMYTMLTSGTLLVLDSQGHCLDHVPTCRARTAFTAVAASSTSIFCASADGAIFSRNAMNPRSFRELRISESGGDLEARAVISQPAVALVACVSGRFLSIALKNRTTLVIDATSGVVVFSERCQAGPVSTLVAAPSLIAISSASDQTVSFHTDPATTPATLHLARLLSPSLLSGSPVGVTDAPLAVTAMAMTSKRGKIIALGTDRGIIWMVDAKSGLYFRPHTHTHIYIKLQSQTFDSYSSCFSCYS